MTKEYILRIEYDPEEETIESITEQIEYDEDTLYFQVEGKELEIPAKISKLLESDILGLA